MNKAVRVILSPEAEEVYKHLNARAPESKLERSILNAINKKVELIKANIHYGEPISKDKIPNEYKRPSMALPTCSGWNSPNSGGCYIR
ncbi:MAG: hypothetical protein V1787_05970 [Candidatus Micrarchaeota archaeon]